MTDLYGLLFRQVLYPAWESGLRRRPTLEHWKRLERSQWRSPDELRALQLEELKKLFAHAFANVPYARSRFERVGIRPEDVRSLDDLA
ncbi:MAG TPA: phenylacetate--CoA ligase family protein, partial [Polyangiaceae bacterium]